MNDKYLNALSNLITAMEPGGIERQEAQGQRDLTRKAERLPIDGTTRQSQKQKEWEAAGFVFDEPVDDLFVKVTFPAGWAMRPTDHSMWSDVVDDKGRRRAMVFYKAAFYDRKAHTFGLDTRYRVDSSGGEKETPIVLGVLDRASNSVVHAVGTYPSWKAYYKADTKSTRKAAEEWLATNFPQHADPLAYWE